MKTDGCLTGNDEGGRVAKKNKKEPEDVRVGQVFHANRAKIRAMGELGYTEFAVLENPEALNLVRSWMAEVLFTNEELGTTSFYTARGASPKDAFERLIRLVLR